MSPYTISYVVLFVLTLLIAIGLIRWLRPGLRGLLEDVVVLPAATEYYLRAFTLVIGLIALAAAADPSFNFKDNVRFMEYVWAVAHGLKSVFENVVIGIFVFTGLMTILMAALRRRS